MILLSIWFFINFFVLLFAIWKISSGDLRLTILFGGLGFLFILYNWTRHAVFSTIRSKRVNRPRKIKFAQISKRLLPFHKWTGTLALIFILIHFFLVFHRYGFSFQNSKMLSGTLALIILVFMVSSGWIRFFKTTYFIRMVHLTLGFCLFISVVIHLIL